MTKKSRKNIPLPQLSAGVTAIDTHCHLDMSAYKEDFQAIIERAFAAGVKKIISVGIDLDSSKAAVALAENIEGVFATVGIHPHYAADVTEGDCQELIALAKHPKVVAYGEIGLDLVKKYTPLDVQIECFQRQVILAKTLNLPLIIHDREAHEEVMRILQAEAPFPSGGVMHCFSGDLSLAEDVLALGFYVSIPGVVTFNKATTLQDVAKALPGDSLLIETDGPFLAPVPMRGKRNEPSYVLYTAQEIAKLRGSSLDSFVAQTTKNAERLFRFG